MMRLQAVLVLTFIFFGTLQATLPAHERSLQANNYYEQGEFKKAYDLYKGITYKSPELLINMGNTAYELNRFPEAIVRWRQAQKYLKPAEYHVLEQRIVGLQLERGGMYNSTRSERLAHSIDLYMRFIPEKVWQLLFLLVIAFGFFLVSWMKKRCWGSILLWFGALVVVFVLLMVRYTVQNTWYGVVLRDTHAYVNKDPHTRIKASFLSGQEVQIRAVHDSWYLITDGKTLGWSTSRDIQLV